jgi:hypothetical protein
MIQNTEDTGKHSFPSETDFLITVCREVPENMLQWLYFLNQIVYWMTTTVGK